MRPSCVAEPPTLSPPPTWIIPIGVCHTTHTSKFLACLLTGNSVEKMEKLGLWKWIEIGSETRNSSKEVTKERMEEEKRGRRDVQLT